MSKLLNIFIIATLLGLTPTPQALADQLPTAADIEKLAKASAGTFDTFFSETFLPRAQLEYSGHFINPQDAEKISTLAKTTASSLTDILHTQQLTCRIIEEYDGNDWDELYGKTSLWRTSVANAQQTRWRICVVDYHRAIASTDGQKEKLLRKVIDQTGEDSGFSVNDRNFLNARASWSLETDNNADVTIRRLDSLIASSGIDNEVFYQAIIMRMKLSLRINALQLDSLAGNLEKSKLKNNFELLFKLALEQLKAGSCNLIKKISAKYPPAANIAGSLILSDIASNASNTQLLSMILKSKTSAEAQLAAVLAIKEQDSKYAATFEQMARIEQFQSDAVYLAAAVSCRQTEPAKAVAFYLEAAKKTKHSKDSSLDIPPAQIARDGARLAYGLYYKDSKYFATAKEAIELHLTMAEAAGNDRDQELAYLYASMLIESDKNERAVRLLKDIAAGETKFANAARFDLIFYNAKTTAPRSPQRKELINTLKNFIDKQTAENNGQPKIKTRDRHLYCKLLLEEGGLANAKAVLGILEKMPSRNWQDIAVLKAAALAETGNLVKAAETLAAAIKKGDSKGAPLLAAALTAEILECIDEYEDKTEDFGEFVRKCYNLARYAGRSITDQSQSEEYQKRLVELGIIKAQKNTDTVNAAQSLLNEHAKGKDDDIDYLRCRARLYMKQDRFAEAFAIWSSIAQARKPASRSAAKPSKWWRAKYYALKCYSKITNPKNNDLCRAIEILINSNENIPPFWKKKLTDLIRLDLNQTGEH